jgi:sulfur relay protein TusB/DsrH
MVLHIFSQGLNQQPLFNKCLALASTTDAVILIEDGVHWASSSPLADALLSSFETFYYLLEDAEARGINRFHPKVFPVNYEGFVELTVKYKTSMSWF